MGVTALKTNEEEDEQILQGVNEEMRGERDGEKEEGKQERKAEIPSSGFSLKPLVVEEEMVVVVGALELASLRLVVGQLPRVEEQVQDQLIQLLLWKSEHT
ncbi:hypothetical protein D9C73_006700 [Collichthys lucidus]|uniref:Uncharacterized protein n=1 Tax=Collichthys lucidus TaxID=240159 RepID=A0A4U5UDQ2_COLLU|nr:hypothetical protein D9C73_006700 [Collichthys lucidus]